MSDWSVKRPRRASAARAMEAEQRMNAARINRRMVMGGS
jgi:hypothetical protein